MTVRLSDGLRSRLDAAAEQALPLEACGLLLGQKIEGSIIVEECIFAENVTTEDPSASFEVDPQTYIQLQRETRAGGPQIIGVWHSHPATEAMVSQTDKLLSRQCGWLWLISGQGLIKGQVQPASEGRPNLQAFVTSSEDPQVFHQVEIEF
ncbi:MAG: M67 family metallopeptidase [Kordiimonadaceae bacterium]|nr:M67 family metallopeptidase [Kordiimonadaceae bacterium]